MDGGYFTGECQQDHLIIANDLAEILSKYSGPCSTDDDCALVNRSISCHSTCEAALPVDADAGAQLQAELMAYGQWACPQVGCNSAGLCPAYEKAICHNGACRHGFADGGLAF